MQLNEVQKRFRNIILVHPKALDTADKTFEDVFQQDEIPLSFRLKIYRNNIVGSLTDVIVAGFPVIEKLVGKEFLEGMAPNFILENPPSQGCLNVYGHGFAEFIENFEPAKSLPYLPDIARFEIALNDSYYAQDDNALSANDLMKISPDDLPKTVLNLRDQIKLISSPYPIDAIRDFALLEQQDKPLNIDQGGVFLMIRRPALDAEIILLEEAEFLMLQECQNKKCLGDAIECVLEQFSDFDFQDFLQKHLVLEIFEELSA